MIKRIQTLSFALLTTVLFIGCKGPAVIDYNKTHMPPSSSIAAYAAPTGTKATSPSQDHSANATTPAAQPADSGVQFKPQVIYNATLALQVDRVSVIQEKAKDVVESFGGYIGDSSPGRMQVRVPAKRFDLALDALASLGDVTSRSVKAQEASERVVDLESRLKSLHALRDRLIEMIDRSENMKHALEIQKELAGVIDQIERINGRLRLTKQQIAYATIHLTIRPTPQEQRLRSEIPVSWVRDLGNVFTQRARVDVVAPRRLGDGVEIDLPDGFIKYAQHNYVTRAVDANGVQIRVRRHKNFDGGSTKFWQQLIQRSLTEHTGLKLDPAIRMLFERGKPGQLIKGHKVMAGENLSYLIAFGIPSDEDYVYTIEAWGVAEHVDMAEDELLEAMQSMRCY